jgi:hypothetical protein
MATLDASTETAEQVIADWPAKKPGQQQHPRETAEQMLERYGEPDEVTPRRLVWHDNGPWTRTEVHRSGPNHRFPIPHVDHLYQFIDYQVPPEKLDDLARYDGSIIVRRTEGQLGITCHKEAANVLALNLAHDVVTGELTPEQAREEYARVNAKMMAGGSPEATRSFRFPLPKGDQREPDVTILTDEIKRNRGVVGLAGIALVGLLYALTRHRRTSTGRGDETTRRRRNQRSVEH